MLIELRDYLRARPFASVGEVANHLEVPAEVARELCQRWVDKGRAERLDCGQGCSRCRLCQGPAAELYRWCG